MGQRHSKNDRRAVSSHARYPCGGPFRLLRAAAPWLRENAKKEAEAGKTVMRKVVNITSISGLGGNAGNRVLLGQGGNRGLDEDACERMGPLSE